LRSLGGILRAGRGTAEFRRSARLFDPNVVPRTGDAGNDRMLEIVAREQPVRPAAVLIPVVDHPEPTVLLTQRSPHLSSHAGQISFPGGKIDATDASPLDAACASLGRGRPQPRVRRTGRLSRSLRYRVRFPHPATIARVKPALR